MTSKKVSVLWEEFCAALPRKKPDLAVLLDMKNAFYLGFLKGMTAVLETNNNANSTEEVKSELLEIFSEINEFKCEQKLGKDTIIGAIARWMAEETSHWPGDSFYKLPDKEEGDN